MQKKFLYNQRIVGAFLIMLTLVFTLVHFLTIPGILPYEKLWGTSMTPVDSQRAAETIAVIFLGLFCFVFYRMLLISGRKWFMRYRGTVRHVRYHVTMYTALLAAVSFLLNVFACIKTDVLAVRIFMSLYCIVLTVTCVWYIHLTRLAFHKRLKLEIQFRKQRARNREKHL